MPDLETLLREVRPAPRPEFTNKLDTRVAARFPSPPPRWKAPLTAFRAHFFAFGAIASTACVALVLIVVGIQSNGNDGADTVSAMKAPSSASSDSSMGSSGSAAVPEVAKKSEPSTGSSPADAPFLSSGPASRARDRAVLRNAAITLSTPPDEVESVVDRAIRLVDGLGGYVETSEVSSSGSRASATLTVKIPSGKLDSGLAQISKLAHVKSRSQQAQDVTDQRSALEATVRDARADREGLRARLAKATTDKQRSSLRARLDRASRRVTRAERAVAALGQEVSFATVELSVEGRRSSGAAAVPGDKWGPGDALSDAGRVLEVIAGVFLIALAILAPVAILAVLAAFGSRILTRRRRERALEGA